MSLSKITKRITVLTMVLITVLLSLALSGCAEDTTELVYELSDDGTGYLVNTEGNFIGTEVTIPATHEGLPVLGIAYKAFKKCENLETVVIESGGEGNEDFLISSEAFKKCKALKSVTVNRSGNITVGNEAFSKCENFQSFNITRAEGVALDYYCFEYTNNLTVSISGADVDIKSSVFFEVGESSTLNLTDCTGELRGYYTNLNLVNCTFDVVEGIADNLVLDNTKLLDDEMCYYAGNATFRGTVIYHNNYEDSWISSDGGIIKNLVIESIGEGSEFSQVFDGEYYPLANNITIGSGITQIPSGVFGNMPTSGLTDWSCKDPLTVTYGGASAIFKQLPYDPLNNGNLLRGEYTLNSADGQPATVTFVDSDGKTVATVDTTIGSALSYDDYPLLNMSLVPGEIVNSYFKDANRTEAWVINSTILGDTTVYVSYVDRALLQKAEIERTNNGLVFTSKDNSTFACEYDRYSPVTLDRIKASFEQNEFATLNFYADAEGTTSVPLIIHEIGTTYVYAHVTSYDKSVTNVYVLEITIKDVYEITFMSDGSSYHHANCTEGNTLWFPNDPYKRGHTFLGWSTDGTEDGIISKIDYVPTATHTLTAVFKQDIYTLKIEGTDLEYQVVWAQSVPLPLAESRDYYDFVGYEYNGELVTDYINENGCGMQRYFFEESITVKPRYLPVSYGVVLYNGTLNETIFFTVEDDDITLPTPTKDWYTFVGWFTEENGGGEQIATIETSTPESRYLYAHFEPTGYTVRFMDGETVIDTQSFDHNNQSIVPPTVPQKDGYTSEWPNFSIVPKDFDVQVERTPIHYIINYEDTFGSTHGNPYTYTVEDTITFVSPSREHYDFVGWKDENGQIITGISKGSIGNITVTAQWEIAKYTVYMFTGDNTYTTQKVQYNTVFNVDAIEIPTATNKLFVGWYNEDYTEQITGKITVTGTVNLYAKWLDSVAISTFEDFEKIRENPAGTFHLAGDVDMRGELVTPISDFSGVIDGMGYKLYNFTLKINSALSSFGLFSNNSGTIRNLTLDEVICSVTTSPTSYGEHDYIGILVGLNSGTISGCHVISPNFTVTSSWSHGGNMHTTLHIGGMVGQNNGAIVNSSSSIIFTAFVRVVNSYPYYRDDVHCHSYARIGGLVGTNSGTVSNSNATSVISATGEAAGNNKGGGSYSRFITGGLVGTNEADKAIDKCYASTSITTATSDLGGGGYHEGYIGGFAGINHGIITEDYAIGNIDTYIGNTSHVGGFVGNVGASGDISNCYTTVSVTSSRASDVGGFVGRLSGSIQNCYSVGDVTVTSGSNVAGFVGVMTSGGVANKCFATGNVNATASNAGFFSANISSGTGIITNCYYSASATVLKSGTKLEKAEENGAKRDYLSNITNQTFLQNKMYFYPEYWIFTTGTPVLKWEIETDGATLTDGGHYYCAICGNEFVNSTSATQSAIYYDRAATCDADGFRYFGCTVCNKHFVIITDKATGHSYTDDSAGKDFCNNDVTVTYTCTNSGCNHTYTEQLTATGHRHNHTDSCLGCGYTYVSATCDTDGSVSFICDDCGNAVTKAIPADHVWEFAAWEVEPTCSSDGYGKFACTRCATNGVSTVKHDYVEDSKIGHMDLTGDGLCDRGGCEEPIYDATDAIEISTAAELLAISKNSGTGSLGETYILMADIDLNGVAWEPIGSAQSPFTGVFLGNGHKIKNVPIFASDITLYYCGLFGYNQGIISNLTVQYDTYTADCTNRNITFGSIAAYNDGTINKCTVAGNIALKFLTKAEVNEAGASASASQAVILGLVTGVNNGFVVGCQVSATYSFTFESYAYMGKEINDVALGLLTSGNYKNMNVSTTQSVKAGAICGVNNMSITNSAVSGTGKIYNNLSLSKFMDGKWGYLSASSNQSFGTIAGNQSLVGMQNNTHTGALTYSNAAGAYNPTEGNDPGSTYYRMSCETTVTIYD
ncbi:MAG: InlB B-repeat-containing protein [Clostridia bacterium]|nr:InlB B-repeat-containing protein [Clostridia bacterium]